MLPPDLPPVGTLTKALKGNAAAITEVRAALAKGPEVKRAIVAAGGDMAIQAAAAMMTYALGDNQLAKDLAEHKQAEMLRDLAGPNPTPLERLLAERIALCWFDLHHREARFAQNQSAGGLTITQADHQQKQIDHAHRRYLQAIKCLAAVRRLQLPTLQVNLAEKQVNVGTMALADPAQKGKTQQRNGTS